MEMICQGVGWARDRSRKDSKKRSQKKSITGDLTSMVGLSTKNTPTFTTLMVRYFIYTRALHQINKDL